MTTMIKVDNVSKRYKLGQIGGTTLRDELQRKRAKLRGEEDPTKPIGAKECAKGETFMALDGVSFEVKKGERVGIIGHNGAGKSTLLKLLSRITAPTDGEIGLNGRVASMLEVGTGFHGELTGRENIYMNGAILGMTKKEIDAKIEDIIEFSECQQFIDTPVKRYSSGMYVKLAFSVAAHLNSEILIMDEVLAVGDMAFQKKCLDKMNDVSRQDGRTILYVSHNMATIRQLCNRCIVLSHGRIIYDGEVEKAIEAYIGAVGNLDITYRYDTMPHGGEILKRAELLGMDIYGMSETRVQRGMPLSFVLRVKCNRDVNNMDFRMEIFTAGRVAGTVFIERSISGKAGRILDVDLTLDTNNFAPSRYSVAALLFENNGYGGQSFFDRVEPALVFEIVDEKPGEITWLPQYFGYTRYNDLKINAINVV